MGGEWQRLTIDTAIDSHPSWSPDGKTIAFTTNRWGDLEIALINPDGSNLRRLTQSKGLDDYPVWSPDGRYVAFTSNRDGNLKFMCSRSMVQRSTSLATRRSTTFRRGLPMDGSASCRTVTAGLTSIPVA